MSGGHAYELLLEQRLPMSNHTVSDQQHLMTTFLFNSYEDLPEEWHVGMQGFKRALVILPYVSIVAEKTATLTPMLQSVGLQVKGYFGSGETGTPLSPW